MKRSPRMSFCVRAATSLHQEDLQTLTDAIETYQASGASTLKAEQLAVEDALTQARSERVAMEAALREQHPDLFKAAKAAVKTGSERVADKGAATVSDAAAAEESPQFTEAQARKQFEWRQHFSNHAAHTQHNAKTDYYDSGAGCLGDIGSGFPIFTNLR